MVQQGFPLITAVWKLDYMVEDLDIWNFNLTVSSAPLHQHCPLHQPACSTLASRHFRTFKWVGWLATFK